MVMSPIKEMSLLAARLQEEQGVRDIISFGQGIPYFDTPGYIKEGIRKALEKKSTARYTLEPGITELRELIARDLEQRKEIAPIDTKKEVMVSTGCQEAMACVLATVLDEGDEILILSPAFPSHIEQTLEFGGIPVFVPFVEKEAWRFDPNLVKAKMTAKTKAILFSHPCNPTGTVLSKEDLTALGKIAKEHDVMIISDETYDFLTYEGVKHISPASFVELRDRVILCGSFSKKYALTGYRVGYCLAQAGIMDHILKVHDALAICAPAISQEAAITALKGTQDSVREFVEKLTFNRELICKKLDELKDLFEYEKPQGAYYVFARYKIPMTSLEFALKILYETHVITIPGIAFGATGQGHLRFSFGCSPEDIQEGFQRLLKWSKTLSF